MLEQRPTEIDHKFEREMRRLDERLTRLDAHSD